MDVDIVIIGAGLAGTSAAIVLARAGFRLALIDAHADYPSEFRAEKIGPRHMETIEGLGLGEIVRGLVHRLDDIWIARYGRVVSKKRGPDFAFDYATLVNGLHGALPPSVQRVIGRIGAIATSDDLQCVTMSDATVLRGRLLVIATGLGDGIRSKVSIERERLSRAHSLSLGFDLTVKPRDLPFASLVCYGRRPSDRLAYCSLFPIADTMRANVFVYRTAGEDWTARFRQSPNPMLRALMPGLNSVVPDLEVKGPVALRSIDLTRAKNYKRAGVVLLGDAFSTCCPVPGLGIRKVFTDVERLTTIHAPRWFESPGMGADKIATYYDDPIKQDCDAEGLQSSLYARSIATEPGLHWAVRRLGERVARSGLGAARDARRMLTRRGAAER